MNTQDELPAAFAAIGHRVVGFAAAAALLIAATEANGAVWTGLSGSTNNWSDATNWQSGLPVSNDNLSFGSFNNQPTNLEDYSIGKAGLSVNSISFDKNAAAFTIHVVAGNSLSIAGSHGSFRQGAIRPALRRLRA